MLQFQLMFVATWKLTSSDCTGPQMMLLSDDPRRTCTDISASKHKIEYSCASLIKDFPRAMIKYCPVEVCTANGNWSKPSISCAMSECYEEGESQKYIGHRTCTASGRPCQRWDTQTPHTHRFRKESMFPDYSLAMAEAFCRDPNGVRGAPWCLTTDPDRKWEFCDVKQCSDVDVSDGNCDVTEEQADVNDGNTTMNYCTNEIQYQMYSNHRLQAPTLFVTRQRTVTECAVTCSRDVTCRAFTFDETVNNCQLHGTSTDKMVISRQYRVGIKVCLA